MNNTDHIYKGAPVSRTETPEDKAYYAGAAKLYWELLKQEQRETNKLTERVKVLRRAIATLLGELQEMEAARELNKQMVG